MEGGFRMGPFELMDLVGVDTGFEISKSFYEQSFDEPRWRPSPITARYVAAGLHGRKSGRGYYDYSDRSLPPPGPGSTRGRRSTPRWLPAAGGVLERILCQVINECAFALGEGVGSAQDIDTGMVLGLNYPRGPLAWADRDRTRPRSGRAGWPLGGVSRGALRLGPRAEAPGARGPAWTRAGAGFFSSTKKT